MLTYEWDLDNDGTYETPGQTVSNIWWDNGSFTIGLKVSDEDGGEGTATATVTVNNVAPTAEQVTATLEPIEVLTVCTAEVAFKDRSRLDTHTASLDWRDGSTSEGRVEEANGSGTAKGEHKYTRAGIYTVEVTVWDDDGAAVRSISSFLIVYDPDAGFVTGGGWIYSPEGAYTPDPSLTGKANFGFVSKYKKGADAPSGETEFQFRVADLNFHSTSYDWLVVTGSDYAMFKGTGTINGSGAYKFMLWAGDGDPDTFRIKIWEEDASGNETVIYDNGFDQAIGSGSIIIHA
jgi:PKD repeat protein